MDNQKFSDLLAAGWPGLPTDVHQRVIRFRELVVDENSRQNLTKLISPEEFFEGHVLDVKALLDCGLVSFPAVDLGSGGGVPGLLAAVIRPDPWILTDSEGHKAAFLSRAVEELGLWGHLSVFPGRAEIFLSGKGDGKQAASVVARAVGPVSRIYTWLRPCSTWNSLVLLKGPRWETEWAEFNDGRFGGELRIANSYEYRVGQEAKQRIIVRLERVPRGTSVRR